MKKTLAILLFSVALSGCVQTHMYLFERPRVDQEVQGIPSPAKPKTRQVVVLEIVDKGPSAAGSARPKPAQADAGAKAVTQENATTTAHETAFTDPKAGSEAMAQGVPAKDGAAAVPSEYKVEKDDTLQKISKKLYGSFSKWTKIYDANKEVIKDPNFLKPGITLKIPAIE